MKTLQNSVTVGLVALLGWWAGGCGTTDGKTKRAEPHAMVNLAPAEGPRGHIKFFTTDMQNEVPIYRVEPKQRPRLLGVIGVSSGSRHELGPRDRHAPVAETLRVSAVPGMQTFLVGRDGARFEVPVVEDKVTPVEIHYVLVSRVSTYDVIRVETRLLDPVDGGDPPP